jgi:hypothetical protein
VWSHIHHAFRDERRPSDEANLRYFSNLHLLLPGGCGDDKKQAQSSYGKVSYGKSKTIKGTLEVQI